MLVFAIVLAAATHASPQIFEGPAFETLADQTDRRCPARRIRSITPGDLDFAQEGFQAQLTQRDRTRLNAVNAADRRCADQNGLTCQVNATLQALRETGLMARFSSYICSHPAPGQ